MFGAEPAQTPDGPPPLPPIQALAPEAKIDINIVQGKLSFEGKELEANMENVARMLRDRMGINVVMSPGTTRMRVGDLKLSSGTLSEALQALSV